MRILILSTEKQFEIQRILEEAKERNHEAEFMVLDEKTSPVVHNFDCVLFRAIEGQVEKAEQIAVNFKEAGKIVVDEKLAKKIDRNKMENYKIFEKEGLYIPQTCFFSSDNLSKLKQFKSREIVLKPVMGKRGKGIRKFLKKNLQKELKKAGKKNMIAQEFVKIIREYRVYVCGSQCNGGMEKESDSWIHNIYAGAKPKKTRLSKKIKEIAVRASLAVQTEISGVDLGQTKKGLFVIEVNRSPGFKGFESIGNNFAKEIIKYLEKK